MGGTLRMGREEVKPVGSKAKVQEVVTDQGYHSNETPALFMGQVDKVFRPDFFVWSRPGFSEISVDSTKSTQNRTIGAVSNASTAISAVPRRQCDCPGIKSYRFDPFPGLDFPAGPYPGAQDTRCRRRHNRCQSVAA